MKKLAELEYSPMVYLLPHTWNLNIEDNNSIIGF